MFNLFAITLNVGYNIIRLFCKGEIMFGKIGDKIKRKAYLSAISESHNEQVAQENKAQLQNLVVKNRVNENRPVVSGKDAQNMARKELNISSDSKKKGIIKNTIADMKYYKDLISKSESTFVKDNVTNINNMNNKNFEGSEITYSDIKNGFDMIEVNNFIEHNTLMTNNFLQNPL